MYRFKLLVVSTLALSSIGCVVEAPPIEMDSAPVMVSSTPGQAYGYNPELPIYLEGFRTPFFERYLPEYGFVYVTYLDGWWVDPWGVRLIRGSWHMHHPPSEAFAHRHPLHHIGDNGKASLHRDVIEKHRPNATHSAPTAASPQGQQPARHTPEHHDNAVQGPAQQQVQPQEQQKHPKTADKPVQQQAQPKEPQNGPHSTEHPKTADKPAQQQAQPKEHKQDPAQQKPTCTHNKQEAESHGLPLCEGHSK
ncbi:MAG: hypothetical protein HQL87_13335 [Magnetococcales bacterium]|nr:hypothetical protein [Magnetococcales bacterium]